jgi:hypothetical protein
MSNRGWVNLSIKRVKAESVAVFVIGIFFLILAIYGTYYLLAVELPSGHLTRLPFAVAASFFLGIIMINLSYSIFVPIKEGKFT